MDYLRLPLDMHHHKTYMYINFQQNQVKTQVMTVHFIYSQKIASCINLQLPIIIFIKLSLFKWEVENNDLASNLFT